MSSVLLFIVWVLIVAPGWRVHVWEKHNSEALFASVSTLFPLFVFDHIFFLSHLFSSPGISNPLQNHGDTSLISPVGKEIHLKRANDTHKLIFIDFQWTFAPCCVWAVSTWNLQIPQKPEILKSRVFPSLSPLIFIFTCWEKFTPLNKTNAQVK